MFDKHREKVAERDYAEHLASWQQERDGTAHMLALAQSYAGDTTSDKLILKPGEHLLASVAGVGLLEERRGQGHYQGASQGLSFPVASLGGHSVRYRVGATRGHYEQGAPVETAVDTGDLFVTDQRVVFTGSHQTRECLFTKLVGVQYAEDGSATFSVSNRQKPTTVHYGDKIAGWVHFRVELALARFRGSQPALVAELTQQLAQLDAAKPVAPSVPR